MDLAKVLSYGIKQRAEKEAKKELENLYKSNFENISFIDVLTEKAVFIEDGTKILSASEITRQYENMVNLQILKLENKLIDYLLNQLDEILK